MFKNTLCFVLLMLVVVFVQAQSAHFLPYSEYQEDELSNNRPILIYNTSPTCGICVFMEKNIFTNDTVRAYLNQNFNLLKLDYSDKDQNEIALNYKMQGGPSFAVLNNLGEFVHVFYGGSLNALQFVNELELALAGDQSETLSKVYQSGDYSNEWLYQYSQVLMKNYVVNQAVVNEYVNGLSDSELLLEKNLAFIYDVFMDNEMNASFSYQSKAAPLLHNRTDLFYQRFDKDQVDVRLLESTYDYLESLRDSISESEYFYLLDSLLTPFEKEGGYLFKDFRGNGRALYQSKDLVLTQKKQYYFYKEDFIGVNGIMDEIHSKVWDDPDALNDLAWGYSIYLENQDYYYKQADKLIQRALSLQTKYAYLDTYAVILQKQGKIEEAKKVAKEAIALAKKNGENYKETERLLETLKTEAK